MAILFFVFLIILIIVSCLYINSKALSAEEEKGYNALFAEKDKNYVYLTEQMSSMVKVRPGLSGCMVL